MPDATDPRPMLHRAFDQASAVVSDARAVQQGDPTPCADFDVQTLVGHLVGVGRRVASIGRLESQAAADITVRGLAPEEWARAFDDARQDAFASWADGAVLARDVALPWATMPGTVVAQVYTLELTVHAWDLAAATGQLPTLDPELAKVSLPVAHQILPADAPRDDMVPFGPIVAVPDDAPAYDRLVGYLGRPPHR